MRRETDNFIIESDTKIDYFEEIVNYILDNEERVLNFFHLNKLPKKYSIQILSYDKFKDIELKYLKENSRKIFEEAKKYALEIR